MIQTFDNIIIFILSFMCSFVVFKLMTKPKGKNEKEVKKLEERINILAKQQDSLLEASTINKDSTFAKGSYDDFKEIESASDFIEKIKVILKKAGITTLSVPNFIAVCAVGGVMLSGVIIHFNFLGILTGVPVGMCIGAYAVFSFLSAQAAKRKGELLKQFPDAIDMMIRGVKAGLNVARIVKLVSIEAKDPIASEYKIISQKFDLGVEPERVLLEAADKIDLEEFRFLVVALVLQMENGGVLAEILQNLSGIIRKRLELDLKLKAMSAEARMSAIVISVLPFVFAGIMALVNPDHLKEFVNPGTGQTLLKVAITLFTIGAFLMLKASKIKV
jgi:tight adherence protein B